MKIAQIDAKDHVLLKMIKAQYPMKYRLFEYLGIAIYNLSKMTQEEIVDSKHEIDYPRIKKNKERKK